MKPTYLECSCLSDEHMIKLIYCKDTEYYPDLYIHYFLQENTFWERVKSGLRYIFGHKCKYGHFGETAFDIENAIKFRDTLDEFIHDHRIMEMKKINEN